MTTEIRESEADFQTWFVDYMRIKGWTIRHVNDSRREVQPGVFVGDKDAADLPDWYCLRVARITFATTIQHRNVWVELKGWQRKGNGWKKGEQTTGQKVYMRLLEACGVESYCFWPEDRAEIMRLFA